jgi:hypothetical protein
VAVVMGAPLASARRGNAPELPDRTAGSGDHCEGVWTVS